MHAIKLPSSIQEISSPYLQSRGVSLFVKRDDLIHEDISGNKWRKLKYPIAEAIAQNCHGILTFGGAYSNHLVATAVACSINGLQSIGMVRGEELDASNPTLRKCREFGMQLIFISREEYRRKEDLDFQAEISKSFPGFYFISEGGAGELGVKGCEEIMDEVNINYDFVAVSAGTGTTAAGILRKMTHAKCLVFPAIKGGEGLLKEILAFNNPNQKEKIVMMADYHFGGYARINEELVDFCNAIYRQFDLKLDLVYTAKLFYGLFDLIEKKYFPEGSRILAIHTGGLQGNQGMIEKHRLKLF